MHMLKIILILIAVKNALMFHKIRILNTSVKQGGLKQVIKVLSISSLVLQVSAKNLFSSLKVQDFLEEQTDHKSEMS